MPKDTDKNNSRRTETFSTPSNPERIPLPKSMVDKINKEKEKNKKG